MKPLVMNLSNQKNQHIVWLDVVRFIAMFTVVCCHCTDPFNFYPGTAPNIGEVMLLLFTRNVFPASFIRS